MSVRRGWLLVVVQGKKGELVQSWFSFSLLSCPRIQLMMFARRAESESLGLPAVGLPAPLVCTATELGVKAVTAKMPLPVSLVTGIAAVTPPTVFENAALIDVQAEKGRAIASSIRAAGGRACFVECDVRDEAQVEARFEGSIDRYGRIDVAVHNAGLGGTVSLKQMTDEQ